MLKVALIWIINDFSSYSMLFGWMTEGKLAYLICMEDAQTFTLKFGEKNLWFDYHKKFLETNNPYRCNRHEFRKNV